MLNSKFLFDRILQNLGIDTLRNSLIKDQTDFIILVKSENSTFREIYNSGSSGSGDFGTDFRSAFAELKIFIRLNH